MTSPTKQEKLALFGGPKPVPYDFERYITRLFKKETGLRDNSLKSVGISERILEFEGH